MSDSKSEDQRLAFETWAKVVDFMLDRKSSGWYVSEYTNDAWQAWQAALKWKQEREEAEAKATDRLMWGSDHAV